MNSLHSLKCTEMLLSTIQSTHRGKKCIRSLSHLILNHRIATPTCSNHKHDSNSTIKQAPLLQASWCCRHSHRTFYNKYTGLDRDWVAKMSQNIDLSPEAIKEWMDKRELNKLREEQKFNFIRHQILDSDLSAAHMIVGRGGSVKMLGDDKWVKLTADKKVPLPNKKDSSYKLECIDASGTNLVYEAFENFFNLQHLAHLDLSNTPHIDDWCLNRLHQLPNLRYLNVSGCPNVTEKGLASLHKLKLDTLVMNDMPSLMDPELSLMLLEEVLPKTLIISELDYMTLPPPEAEAEKLASGEQQEAPVDDRDEFAHPNIFKAKVGGVAQRFL